MFSLFSVTRCTYHLYIKVRSSRRVCWFIASFAASHKKSPVFVYNDIIQSAQEIYKLDNRFYPMPFKMSFVIKIFCPCMHVQPIVEDEDVVLIKMPTKR